MLAHIDGPADLKRLTLSDLRSLAAEIRALLVRQVTENGGHLASNLGIVELTLALHYVFDSPRDAIVFDVGHQSYVHKLVTGRHQRFATLRQHGGLSGFCAREESAHDPFGAGHAGTSVSAALGIAAGRRQRGVSGHVVAVIGDGAMTCGLAFEGINNAGHLAVPLIVVLNDNAMSISPNVGALAQYLARLRMSRRYHQLKATVERVLAPLPFGVPILKALRRLQRAVRALLVPVVIWEELGFSYLGPVDGHDFPRLIAAFRRAQAIGRPVVVHVTTQKGKGYPPAEADAVALHGMSPRPRSASNGPASPTYTEAFGDALIALAHDDPRLVAITAAMPDGTGLAPFARAFPARFFDVGIAEGHAVTFAAGLAAAGLRPVVAIYSTFLQRAYDSILHDVCLQRLPVVFAVDRAGLVGEDGRTHHGAFDLSFLRALPNLVVMAPRDEAELRRMLCLALRLDAPVAIRYPRGSVPPAIVAAGVACLPHAVAVADHSGASPDSPVAPVAGASRDSTSQHALAPLALGRGELLRDGQHLALIALGSTVVPSLAAADLLAQTGVSAAVLDARFAKPLDEATILHLARVTGHLVTIEENVLAGGLGSAVAELLASHHLLGPIALHRIGLPDAFVEHGPQSLLRDRCGLSPAAIARSITTALSDLARAAP